MQIEPFLFQLVSGGDADVVGARPVGNIFMSVKANARSQAQLL